MTEPKQDIDLDEADLLLIYRAMRHIYAARQALSDRLGCGNSTVQLLGAIHSVLRDDAESETTESEKVRIEARLDLEARTLQGLPNPEPEKPG